MAIPDMTPVESSNLKAVGYDPEAQALHVQFKNGGHYQYAGVPPDAHQALLAADSKGSHIAKNIVGKYTHTKLDTK